VIDKEFEEKIYKKIEEEVSKAVFFHMKAVEQRLDQFIFDLKISLKNDDKNYFEIIENFKDDLELWEK
jgi:predicted transcriptional regulator